MAYYEDIVVIPNNFLKCILCDEVMSNNNKVIESHLENRKHRELYMKRLMSRHSIIIKNTELFCTLCNQNIEIAKLMLHVENSNHCKNLSSVKEIIERDGKFARISDKKNCIDCCICNSEMVFSLSSVTNHLQSAIHCRAKAMVLQPLNGIFSVEDNDAYLWCKVCQIFFDNYIEIILQHVEQTDHATTMCKISRLIDGQNIDIDKYLQSLKEDKAFCKKCKIEVPCNVDNLQRHINGKKHYSS